MIEGGVLMRTRTSDEYMSNRAWLRDVVAGQSLILRGTSALEYLELIDGYFGEDEIFVYSNAKGRFENINYTVTNSFELIEFVCYGDVLCSTFNQALNDMLSDELVDEQALCEALSNYYHLHNDSFENVKVNKENKERFDYFKDSAISYYSGG